MTGQRVGLVKVDGIEYTVVTVVETVSRSIFHVSSADPFRRRSFHAAEVRVGEECRFVCLGCLHHPKEPKCIHERAVIDYVATLPIERVELRP